MCPLQGLHTTKGLLRTLQMSYTDGIKQRLASTSTHIVAKGVNMNTALREVTRVCMDTTRTLSKTRVLYAVLRSHSLVSLCALCSVLCALCSVLCALCCALCSVLCALCSVLCALCSVLCALYSMLTEHATTSFVMEWLCGFPSP